MLAFSTGPTRIAVTLPANPRGGVLVPVVAVVVDGTGGSLEVGSATGLAHRLDDGLAHETTAGPRAGELVDLSHQPIVELYVHSHVQKLAPGSPARPEVRATDAGAPGCSR